jgi:hypothetical protein
MIRTMLNIFFLFIITSYYVNSFVIFNRKQYICTHNNIDYYKLVDNLKYKLPSGWIRNQSIHVHMRCDTPKYYAKCKSNNFKYTYKSESTEYQKLPFIFDMPTEPGIYQSIIHEEIITHDYLCIPNYIDTKTARRRNNRNKNKYARRENTLKEL